MKRLFSILAVVAMVFAFASCEKQGSKIHNVVFQLTYPQDIQPAEGVTITVTSATDGTEFSRTTNQAGQAIFELANGLYNANASDTRGNDEGGVVYAYNGNLTNVNISKEWDEASICTIPMAQSTVRPIIIKELMFGGCTDNEGVKKFNYCKYVTLYNNSMYDVSLKNLCLAFAIPFNSNINNKDYKDGTSLWYENNGYNFSGDGYWTFGENGPTLKGGESITVSINGAIDHTTTYTNAVDLSKAEYYVCYDPESGYEMVSQYPTPSENIPASHYLKAFRIGQSKAWALSINSPAFFIFTPQDGVTPQTLFDDTTLDNYLGDNMTAANKRKMINNAWIFDAVEVFVKGNTSNKKRFTSAIDGGAVEFTNGQGNTVYRNVDKDRTEAIPGNKEKLVYNYAGGTEDSTDPSGIDAEASIKNGAFIYFKDSNNSTNDFHARAISALK